MVVNDPGVEFVPQNPEEPHGLQWLAPCGGLKAVCADAPVYLGGEVVGRVVTTAAPSRCTVRLMGFDGERWVELGRR